jgi:putative phosphoesterase
MMASDFRLLTSDLRVRYLILSDVHANWEALWALQHAEHKPDAVLFLGDAVGLGADPDRCATWLRANVTRAVGGDHDAAVFDADELMPGSRVCCGVDATIEYAARTLSPLSRDFIAGLCDRRTVQLGGGVFHMTHAGPTGLFDRFDLMTAPKELLEAEFKDVAADVVLVGHTHRPGIRQIADKVIVAPGSLGAPRYGVPDATFAAWTDGTIKIHHLHYDHHAAARKLDALPLDASCRQTLQQALEQGM